MTVLDILDYRAWKPVIVSGLGVLIILGVTFGAGYWQGTKRNQAKVTQAETHANIAKGERDAITAQAQAKDQTIAAKDAAIAADKKALARANAEIQRIKDRPPVVPVGPGTANTSPVVECRRELTAARELIAAYEVGKLASEQFTKGLETKIDDLTISRDLWKASTEAGAREAAGLRIALEAQKSLTRNALWRGRIQGLAIGLGSGYVIGRSQR
ncbi:MAG: hypothetical protein C0436_04175 [Alphaproteobacteria bacterium]|nr:hypothetical protein [Alphaproteobacteria bacterium]